MPHDNTEWADLKWVKKTSRDIKSHMANEQFKAVSRQPRWKRPDVGKIFQLECWFATEEDMQEFEKKGVKLADVYEECLDEMFEVRKN